MGSRAAWAAALLEVEGDALLSNSAFAVMSEDEELESSAAATLAVAEPFVAPLLADEEDASVVRVELMLMS